MKVTNGVGAVTRLYIEDALALDPVTVLMEDFEPGIGRVTIICWGEVWTSFWGAMSGQSVAVFFMDGNREYLVDRLLNGQRSTKAKKAYLFRIVDAVKAALAISAERTAG